MRLKTAFALSHFLDSNYEFLMCKQMSNCTPESVVAVLADTGREEKEQHVLRKESLSTGS